MPQRAILIVSFGRFLLLDVHWNRQICSYSPRVADSVNYLIFNPTLTGGIHLGVTWVCVHDLIWHQNDLKVDKVTTS